MGMMKLYRNSRETGGTAMLRSHCEYIVREAIRRVQPDSAVQRALEQLEPGRGKRILVAAGKAA